MCNIKKATTADIPLIRSLAESTFPHTYREILTSEQIDYMMEWMYGTASLLEQMTQLHHVFYLAYDNGNHPIGYFSIEPQTPMLVHLQKLYILPSKQGLGYGRVLLLKAFEVAQKECNNVSCRVQLNVNKYNKALGFYQHNGMKKVDEGDYDIGHGYFMNDYIMEISLS